MSFSLTMRLGSGYDFTGGSGGLVGTPLTLSISPVQIRQLSPGGQLFTATPAGGTGPYTYERKRLSLQSHGQHDDADFYGVQPEFSGGLCRH